MVTSCASRFGMNVSESVCVRVSSNNNIRGSFMICMRWSLFFDFYCSSNLGDRKKYGALIESAKGENSKCNLNIIFVCNTVLNFGATKFTPFSKRCNRLLEREKCLGRCPRDCHTLQILRVLRPRLKTWNSSCRTCGTNSPSNALSTAGIDRFEHCWQAWTPQDTAKLLHLLCTASLRGWPIGRNV